jgi:energy-coupling factor transporter ATP-binding protein EcfA2
MVKLIAGEKGSGKSKKLIKIANDEMKSSHGNIVFLDDNDRNIFDLSHDIRFIDISEYEINTLDGFVGFISGMVSKDYDMDTVFVDGLFKIANMGINDVLPLITRINEIGDKYDIKFYLTVSHPIAKIPTELEKYLY